MPTPHHPLAPPRPPAALPASPPWEAWLAAGGEAAPDFDRLPSRPELWCPSAGISAPTAWPARRAAIHARWRRWLLGAMPAAPADLHAREVRRSVRGDGVQERLVDLRPAGPSGPPLGLRVLLPAGATAPVPALLVASTHERWADQALARGWAACLVRACDDDDDMDAVAAALPALDWSRLARRAWALSRALDALRGLAEVDHRRVVVAGHSRNGKAAIIAAAHDERFAAVVSSSAGVLGAMPARLCTDRHFGEGIELLTRHYPDWFH